MKLIALSTVAATASAASTFKYDTWCGKNDGMILNREACKQAAKDNKVSFKGNAGGDWHAGCIIHNNGAYFTAPNSGHHSNAVNGGYLCNKSQQFKKVSSHQCNGYAKIQDETACKRAAQELGKKYQSKAGPEWRQGCIQNKGKIYFSPPGAGSRQRKPNQGAICVKTSAPTSAPTDAPTDAPTNAPTNAPTDAPTAAATVPASSGVAMELGAFGNTLTHVVQKRTFEEGKFANKPAVFAGVLGFDGGDAAVPVVQAVSKTGAEFFVDEPQCYDGRHTTETLDWMAMENGQHKTDEGRDFLVGTTMSNKGKVSHGATKGEWVTVSYPEMKFKKNVVVIVTAQSTTQEFDDEKWYNIRVQNVGKKSFQFHVENEIGDRTSFVRQAVKVSYLVIEEGEGSINNYKYNALKYARTDKAITHQAVVVASKNEASLLSHDPHNGNPLVFASVSHTGWDTASLRITTRKRGKDNQLMMRMVEPTAAKCGWDGDHPATESAFMFIIADEHKGMAKNCQDWSDADWCSYYTEADEELYKKYGCGDDGSVIDCGEE